jgi:two-component system, cell cycle response regulator
MGKKVLTIDDSKTVRTIISKYLEQFSVAIFEAEDGEQGVACARKNIPDLILLDYNMPVMDGYHTLIELKTDPVLKPIPVFMVTTETSKETVVKLLKLGLNDYIAKPFTRELLLKKLNPILELYKGEVIPPESEKDLPQEQVSTEPEEADAVPTILVVDDKASIRELMKDHLSDQFQLVMADCGRTALAAIEQRSFDYIFLDISLPDMSGFDVFNAYMQHIGEGASEKKVIAMTLRSALQDIHRANELGIPGLLYKPFTRAEVLSAIERSAADQKEINAKKLHYLTVNGKVLTLECPAQKSSKYRFYAESLASEIPQEIDNLVEEGADLLIITIGEGFLSKQIVSKNFIKLIQHATEVQLSVRLVADSPASRDVLKKYSETSNLPIDVSLECALNSIAC